MSEYVPSLYNGGNLEQYVQRELAAVSEIIALLVDGQLDIRYVAPERPRNGIYYADGTDWNPGSGKGLYRYDEDTTSYVHLG